MSLFYSLQSESMPIQIGAKGTNIYKLSTMGFKIPNTIFIPCLGNNEQVNVSRYKSTIEYITDNLNNLLAADNGWMIRSSYMFEDDINNSCAGIYKSVYIKHRHQLSNAIDEVINSAESDRHNMGVVIQKYITADYAGVVFSIDPTKDNSQMLLEICDGGCEDFVNGSIQPCRYNNADKKYLRTHSKDIQVCIEEIFDAAQTIQKRLGYPVDIEWAIENSEVYYLQVRPITSYKLQQNDFQKELDDFLGSWIKSPEHGLPMTPLELSYDFTGFFEHAGFSVKTINNYPYLKWMSRPLDNNKYIDSTPVDEWNAVKVYYDKDINMLLDYDLDSMSQFDLWDLLNTTAESFKKYIKFYMQREWFIYRRKLTKKIIDLVRKNDSSHNAEQELSTLLDVQTLTKEKNTQLNNLVNYIEENNLTDKFELKQDNNFNRMFSQYKERFGCESQYPLNIYNALYTEENEIFINSLISRAGSGGISRENSCYKKVSLNFDSEDERIEFNNLLSLLKQLIIRTEDDDYYIHRYKAVIRSIILQLNKCLGYLYTDDIFFYTYDEVEQAIFKGIFIDNDTILKRKFDYSKARTIVMPPTIKDGTLIWKDSISCGSDSSGFLVGQAVSYGYVKGRITDIIPTNINLNINSICDGIVILEHISPQMLIYLKNAKGLIIEEGGILSHGAILARELKIPTIIGVKDACKILKKGQNVIIDCEVQTVQVLE